jgi:hypothetical protein
MSPHLSLTSVSDRTHHAFIVGARPRGDGTVVLYLSRRYVSPTTGVAYRTAKTSMQQYTDFLAANPGADSRDHAVEIVFRGTNCVRTITTAPAESVPMDEYLRRDGGYDWTRYRGRPQ